MRICWRRDAVVPPTPRSGRHLSAIRPGCVSSARPVPASPARGLANPPRFQVRIAASAPPAGVAQLVEQRIRNAKVGSSTLFTGTRFLKRPPLRWPFWSELLKKRNSTNKYHVYIQNHQHIAIINKNQCCDYFHKKQSSIF